MDQAHAAVDELTIEGKKNLFIEGLKEGYRARCTAIPPIPYLKDRYNVSDVFVESDIRFLRKEDSTRSTWERLGSYDSVLTDRRVKSQRIIIQADSGYGKTFLSLHFAHAWYTQTKGSPLCDVEILIVLQLRQLGEKSSIYRAIRRFLLPKGSKIKVKDIEQILHHCKSVLIILDGYDEYNFKNQASSDINRVIAGSMFKDVNVILTGRYMPHAFDRSVTRIVGLYGFDEKARDEYIRKAVTGDNTEEQNRIQRELEENLVMAELSQVPLLFVSFAHMALKHPIKEKFHTVRKFFGSVIHCFHDHLKHKTTDPHVKEMCIMFDKDTNTEFNELALNILLSGGGAISLDKIEMCRRIGEACYEHFRRIGVIVEEEVIEDIDDDDDDDADINTITKARFSHNLFCEWYASFTFSHLASGDNEEAFKKIMDEFDPIELQYFYRFSCGCRPSAGKKIIEKLADTDDGVQILPGCITENRGPDTDVVPTIEKLFSKRAKITPRDTRLYQKSIVFLLNLASRLEMEVSLNLCESFDSINVDHGVYSIILQSGIEVPPISTLNGLNIATEHGRRMTEEEVNMILKYVTQCDKVIILMFQFCELPEKISTSDALVLMESRGVKVRWLDCAHCFNYSSGGWQVDDMNAVKLACFNGVSIHEECSSHTQGLQIELLKTASTNDIPLKLWLRKSYNTIDPTNGDVILKSGLRLPMVTTAESIHVETEDGRQLTQDDMMGLLRYATFSKQLELVSFLDCELPSSIPNGDILSDIRSRGAKVQRRDCGHQINPQSGEWEIDDDETIRDICLKGLSIYKHWSEFTQNLLLKLLEVASNNEIPIDLWLDESFSKVDPVSHDVMLTSGLPLPKVTSLDMLHIRTEEGRLIKEDEMLGIMKYAANSDKFRELSFQYCDMPPSVSVGDVLSTFKSKGAKVSWEDCGHHLNNQSGQWEIDDLENIHSRCRLGLGIYGSFSKHAHQLQIELLQTASKHNINIKGISLKQSFSKVDMKTGHIILTSGVSLPHISTNWGLSVYDNGRELTELDTLALLYYLQNVRLLQKSKELILDFCKVDMKTGHIILTSGVSLPHISTNWGLSVYDNGRELTELDTLALLYYLQNVRLLQFFGCFLPYSVSRTLIPELLVTRNVHVLWVPFSPSEHVLPLNLQFGRWTVGLNAMNLFLSPQGYSDLLTRFRNERRVRTCGDNNSNAGAVAMGDSRPVSNLSVRSKGSSVRDGANSQNKEVDAPNTASPVKAKRHPMEEQSQRKGKEVQLATGDKADAGDEDSLKQAAASARTLDPDIEEMTEEEQVAYAIKMSLELEDGSRCFTSGKTE